MAAEVSGQQQLFPLHSNLDLTHCPSSAFYHKTAGVIIVAFAVVVLPCVVSASFSPLSALFCPTDSSQQNTLPPNQSLLFATKTKIKPKRSILRPLVAARKKSKTRHRHHRHHHLPCLHVEQRRRPKSLQKMLFHRPFMYAPVYRNISHVLRLSPRKRNVITRVGVSSETTRVVNFS